MKYKTLINIILVILIVLFNIYLLCVIFPYWYDIAFYFEKISNEYQNYLKTIRIINIIVLFILVLITFKKKKK